MKVKRTSPLNLQAQANANEAPSDFFAPTDQRQPAPTPETIDPSALDEQLFEPMPWGPNIDQFVLPPEELSLPDPDETPEIKPDLVPDRRSATLAVADPEPTIAPMGSPASLGALATTSGAEAEAKAAQPETTVPPSDLFIDGPPAKMRRRISDRAAANPAKVYALAGLATVLWTGSLVAFVYGFNARIGPFEFDPFTLILFSLMALGPVGFMAFAAFALTQGARFGVEARRVKALADEMVGPAALAAGQTGAAVASIRNEIDSAVAAAVKARLELTQLRDALAEETQRLLDAAATSTRTAESLTNVMGQERAAMGAMAGTMDSQADRVMESVARQARMVSEASDLAETQLREAEATLVARAADLTAAASDTQDAALRASQVLERQIERLVLASHDVNHQAQAIETSMARQGDELASAADALTQDRRAFDDAFNTRQTQLAELIQHSMDAAEAVGQSVADASIQFERLAEVGIGRAEEIGEAARHHRAAMASAAVESLSALTEASLRHREVLMHQTQDMVQAMLQAAEDARYAADAQVTNARSHMDQLSETAFSTGQQAEAMFEARLNEARSLIDQSARLAEEAASRSTEQLSQGLVTTREVVAEFAVLLTDLEQRMAQLPHEAARQAEAVSAGLAEGLVKGIEDLTASAKRAAEETQAIDTAFQERVRSNYQALGEAVRQMETLAARAAAVPAAARAEPVAVPPPPIATPAAAEASTAPVAGRPVLRPAPVPVPAPAPAPASPPASAAASTPIQAPVRPVAPVPATAILAASPKPASNVLFPGARPRPAPPPPKVPIVDLPTLRPRLKLTPTSETDEVRSVFEQPSPRPTPSNDRWTWKDLLTSIEDSPVDDDQLAEQLIHEISGMRIDAQSILPRARIDEIAAAINVGDHDGAMDQVSRLAPSDIHRLARRLNSDRDLMARAERFVDHQAAMIAEASSRDREGFLTPTLLSNEQGRAYLLLTAALSDDAA